MKDKCRCACLQEIWFNRFLGGSYAPYELWILANIYIYISDTVSRRNSTDRVAWNCVVIKDLLRWWTYLSEFLINVFPYNYMNATFELGNNILLIYRMPSRLLKNLSTEFHKTLYLLRKYCKILIQLFF